MIVSERAGEHEDTSIAVRDVNMGPCSSAVNLTIAIKNVASVSIFLHQASSQNMRSSMSMKAVTDKRARYDVNERAANTKHARADLYYFTSSELYGMRVDNGRSG